MIEKTGLENFNLMQAGIESITRQKLNSERIDNRDRVGLFRRLSREFGRCSSKVYVGEGTPVGWVFEKKALYDDTRETYIMETWVTITEERHVALDDMEAA